MCRKCNAYLVEYEILTDSVYIYINEYVGFEIVFLATCFRQPKGFWILTVEIVQGFAMFK